MTKDITCIYDTGSKYEQDAAGNKYLKNQILIFTLSSIILVTI